ncbi:BspA family leucine-rich repeat surface protein [Chryseobacterium paridis]|uniref:BspA family leucine-rich repeat surface protein n=1 Tax=Chryseobacterium paridis TaxID=2800328 RepID=A0ABS1FYF9_9FLAO|nr:BspA family leucine-rich repeat surface protein [Chryseobacterium paridis]MBK1897447.1 BspA family leucine-rich repeat surface protein [Chryseobacterium paridis]
MYKKLIPFILFLFFFHFGNAQNEFITVWKPSLPRYAGPYSGISVPSTSTQIWLPAVGTDFQVYWEEIGFPSNHATLTNLNSTYQILIDFGSPMNPNPSDATYRVKISNGNGNFHRIRFSNWDLFINGDGLVGDVHKIVKLEQWGNIHWSSMGQAFQACRDFDVTATDIPDLSGVTDMSNMFLNNYTLIGNPTFNDWDTSHITNLLATFAGCFVFNQPVGNWDTSKVTMMGITFNVAKKFNQPISNWNTSKVTHMTAMFSGAEEFNQPIGNWDLSSNIDCEFMFSNAKKFNQPIGNWNTSNVIEMDRMFNQAKAFNQDISNWDTSSATNMEGMFAGASTFNHNIGNWDLSKVLYTSEMFNGASQFNQNIGNWDVSKVIWMHNMFKDAKDFNQNIGNWNVSLVTNMTSMFNGATQFNQSLGQWNLSSLVSASNMLLNSGLNCQNYDNTLYGWNLKPTTPNNINLGSAAPLIYSNALAVNARNNLITNKTWTITGDAYNGECQSFLSTSDVLTHNEISIYPNPATDFIYIKNAKGFGSYKIFDVSGRIVLQNSLNDEKINISSLTKGNYILKIISKDKIQSLKLIKN